MKRFIQAANKVLALLMSAIMIIGALVCADVVIAETVKAKDYGISNPRINEDGSVTWDKIKFGRYKQSAEFKSEPIKWRILSIDEDNNALLLADKGLINSSYNYNLANKNVSWETCTLRAWLNSNFYENAFNEEEQAEINLVTVKNEENLIYDIKGSKDTLDKVFLLSIEEACNDAYGFDSIFSNNSDTRICNVTEYTTSINPNLHNHIEQGNWWLRSFCNNSNVAAYVNNEGGGVSTDKIMSSNCSLFVRPVIQINLSSSYIRDAGEVSSDGKQTYNNDGYNNPKKIDNNSVWDCIYFGEYKQDISKKPIEWRVLSVGGDEALLLADNGLDYKCFSNGVSSKWENSELRKWLNGQFYSEAFNAEECTAIKEVTVINSVDDNTNTKKTETTIDKVYLLSKDEVCNISYGFDI